MFWRSLPLARLFRTHSNKFHLRRSPSQVRSSSWSVIAVSVGTVLLLAACTQNMALQPYNRPYTPSDVLPDRCCARPLPADTVARGHTRDDTLLFTGKDSSGQDSIQFPFPITRDVLQRGRDCFEIYRVPCHGYTGDGDGVV